MADETPVYVLAQVLSQHAWDYARSKCACSAPGVTWFNHHIHVAKLQRAALEAHRG